MTSSQELLARWAALFKAAILVLISVVPRMMLGAALGVYYSGWAALVTGVLLDHHLHPLSMSLGGVLRHAFPVLYGPLPPICMHVGAIIAGVWSGAIICKAALAEFRKPTPS